MKGCICLDIDGTITADPFSIPKVVISYFETLQKEGWSFLFSTGRDFSFASKLFKDVSFPFFLSLQNGADVLEMPKANPLYKQHLSYDIIPDLEKMYQDLKEDFLVYAGWQEGDFCYYRPHRFSCEMLEHLKRLESFASKPWRAIEDFSLLKGSSFSLIKGLGSLEEMNLLHERLERRGRLQVSMIEDPLARGSIYLNLITASKVTKGSVINKLRDLFPKEAVFIAAGDDYNDIPLLEAADRKIAMEGSPKALIERADLIAKSAKEMGIIKALQTIIGE
jgi:hydroxymethylpyrimidine pyrophosphatase-like HAD family hydrolase